MTARRVALADTLAVADGHRRDVRYACISFAGQQVLLVVGAAIAGYVVSRAVRGASYSQLSSWVLVLVLVSLPQVRLPWAASAALSAVANRVRVEQSDRLFRAVDHLDPAELAGRRSGDLTAVAADDIARLVRFFAHDVGSSVSSLSMMAAATLAIAVLDWRLGALSALLVAAWVVGAVRGGGPRPDPATGHDRAEVIDDLAGLREIVSFGAAPRRAVTPDRPSGPGFAGGGRPANQAVAALAPATVLAAAALLVGRGAMAPTLVAPVVLLSGLAARAGWEWSTTAPAVVDALGVVGRLRRFEDAASTIVRPDSGPVPVVHDIAFDDVTAGYTDEVDALHGVSFEVGQGQTVAVVGHSGAGKSTSLRLLLRFLAPDGGAVRIGGHDISQLTEPTLRGLIGYVPQDTYLFNTSIRRNLALGNPRATDADLEVAARTAMAWEFIRAIPGGLDAHIGERGAQLSGGQRQRLAIARALVADRPILILDEPVSSLDIDNEMALLEAMGAVRAGRTTLIVAHRRSTTRQADQVVVLDQGRVTAVTSGAEHRGAG